MAPKGDLAGIGENWKCALAILLVSMSPFQYGIDFSLIGGIQAMKGFLEVCAFCREPAGCFLLTTIRSLATNAQNVPADGTSHQNVSSSSRLS